ncbi:MAG: imidazolonepropionase [Acidobacteria bacterium]|nr:imidazolonepropionase [Acidobacteriota bacterium]
MSEALLITGCRQLATLRGPAPRRGKALRDLGIINDGALLIRDGKIIAVGTRRAIERRKDSRRAKKFDVGGRVVLPGFVDSHTHLVFAGNRAEEYEQRISGATYEQIAKSGGGILSTVRKVRATDADALYARASKWLNDFAAHGTTTVEAKSGYGLDASSELKILRVLAALRKHARLEIVPTFMGAHVVPPEFRKRPDAYVNLLAHKLLPYVAKEGLAEFCDVFCDRGAFTVEQARLILTAARACGLAPRIHAEQLARTGAAQLAVELHAASADHLEKVNAADIRALAKSDVTCTLLPGCCFHLGLEHYAPARKFIDAGAIVALATDFNPGTSPSLNMQLVLSLACTQMRMTPAEAICAATINAAYSLRRAERIGSLEVCKFADLAVFDVEDFREIPYYFGVNRCWLTLKNGKQVFERSSTGL